MPHSQIKTPIVFVVFNRVDNTEKVFEAIRQVKPPKLLVIADGPRANKPGEAEKCAAVRAIIDRVDWDCEVLKNYSEINFGCKDRISSGFDWVFNTVEEAIILEDDCLPHPSFFPFCEQLLEHYRDDKRIMSISGVNFQFGRKRTEDSYYFSRFSNCWGWATWRRAWQYYDVEMKLWPQLREAGFLENLLANPQSVKVWDSAFQVSYDGTVNNWFFRWLFTCWVQNGLAIIPEKNLISNIGFGSQATHTSQEDSIYSNMPTEAMTFPLRHPNHAIRNFVADQYTQDTFYDYQPALIRRIKKKINKLSGSTIFNLE
ncbi:glycosyltransferase family 2 protein [Microcoleus sp. S28C3]|uniref:glycosyltransferase family 2 protein n=1 Tax=Microcoleus sp. S28C3 TaxID=3055414 RepID=UPI002FD632F9